MKLILLKGLGLLENKYQGIASLANDLNSLRTAQNIRDFTQGIKTTLPAEKPTGSDDEIVSALMDIIIPTDQTEEKFYEVKLKEITSYRASPEEIRAIKTKEMEDEKENLLRNLSSYCLSGKPESGYADTAKQNVTNYLTLFRELNPSEDPDSYVRIIAHIAASSSRIAQFLRTLDRAWVNYPRANWSVADANESHESIELLKKSVGKLFSEIVDGTKSGEDKLITDSSDLIKKATPVFKIAELFDQLQT